MLTRKGRTVRRTLGLALGIWVYCAADAAAGVYSDDLSKCLVSSTTQQDQTDLVRWMFATVALHPDVANIVSVSAKMRSDMTATVGRLFERLLTESCPAQYRDASKYEGAQAMFASFQVLGQVAMRTLIENPAVAQGFDELGSAVNEEKLQAVAGSPKP